MNFLPIIKLLLYNGEGFDTKLIRDKKDVHPSHITKVFEEEDVKSAVEWLKFKFNDDEDNDIIALIDEAFEDVI